MQTAKEMGGSPKASADFPRLLGAAAQGHRGDLDRDPGAVSGVSADLRRTGCFKKTYQDHPIYDDIRCIYIIIYIYI